MFQQLSDQELDEYINSHDIVILDIFATWCGPCVLQARILEEIAKEIKSDKVSIVKMDADQSLQTCERFRVQAIPTVILFKGGQPVKTHVGVWPKEELLRELTALQK